MKLPPLDYASPLTAEEVVRVLAAHKGDARIISGGQSLIPLLAFRLAAPKLLVDLRRIEGLDQIAISDRGIELGAKVTWRQIEADKRLQEAHPLLHSAVSHVAHYQIRNRGTVGGSLAHADPAAELPAVAIACDARIVALGPSGQREIAAADFFVAPLTTCLKIDELILALRLPPWPPGRKSAFSEYARRRGDFALAGVALFYDQSGGVIQNAHVAAFGVEDVPSRLSAAEGALDRQLPNEETFQRAVDVAARSLDSRSDIHADADYRRGLFATLMRRALHATARQVSF